MFLFYASVLNLRPQSFFSKWIWKAWAAKGCGGVGQEYTHNKHFFFLKGLFSFALLIHTNIAAFKIAHTEPPWIIYLKLK